MSQNNWIDESAENDPIEKEANAEKGTILGSLAGIAVGVAAGSTIGPPGAIFGAVAGGIVGAAAGDATTDAWGVVQQQPSDDVPTGAEEVIDTEETPSHP